MVKFENHCTTGSGEESIMNTTKNMAITITSALLFLYITLMIWADSSASNLATIDNTANATADSSNSDKHLLSRVIISTDIGGYDPDDFQAMVHYLVHADMFDTEGIIASPPGAGRVSDILATLDVYEKDYSNLSAHGNFPTSQSLRNISKQGATNAAPSAGYRTATEGSNWIITRAHATDPRPLWILVWGSATDLAQALHDDPIIKSKIRVYLMGSWNTMMDTHARDYIYNNHPDLWLIECNTTMRGMYIGGDQNGDLESTAFLEQHIRHHGALGDFYYSKPSYEPLKMGDTPSELYLLNGNPDDPATPHWGGMFRATDHGPHYWTDITDLKYSQTYHKKTLYGAKTVNVWRQAYLRDWQTRMEWAAGTSQSDKKMTSRK